MSVKGRMTGKMKPVERLRSESDQAAERPAEMPVGVTSKEAEFPPVNAEWLIPDGAEENKAILYFHRGGFLLGNLKSHRSIVGNFVKMMGYKALLFDYRLAPEYPASSAVHDSAAVYTWMLENGYDPKDIIFAGDSAGGGIEIATLIKLRDEGNPLPAACIAFSPSLDMTASGESAKADLTGLPPIMIQVGYDEALRDDSTRFAERADSFGVDIRVKVWKGMSHCFPLMAPMFEEAIGAMQQVRGFIRQHIGKEQGIPLAMLYLMMYY